MDLNEITKLVAKGQTEEALDALRKDAQIFQQEIILLNTRYENLEKQVIEGTISEEVRMLETNRINAAILKLVQNYKEKQEALSLKDKLPREKQGASKGRSAGRSRMQLSTFLIPLGLLLLIAAVFIFFMFFYKDEPPVQEQGKRQAPTEAKVDVEHSSESTANEMPAVAFAPTEEFKIMKIGSTEGGKFSYEITKAAYGDNQLRVEVIIRNRFDVPFTIAAFKLSDFKPNGQEGNQCYQQAAKNMVPIELQANGQQTFKPIFDYKLGGERKFAFYIDYKVPQRGINSRASPRITLLD
ncbi:MAG: hypothetical protein AAGG75_11435 [Bacteroidota bacterium]